MPALEKNDTWEFVLMAKGNRVNGCCQVYTPKFKADGTLERLKSCLDAMVTFCPMV